MPGEVRFAHDMEALENGNAGPIACALDALEQMDEQPGAVNAVLRSEVVERMLGTVPQKPPSSPKPPLCQVLAGSHLGGGSGVGRAVVSEGRENESGSGPSPVTVTFSRTILE